MAYTAKAASTTLSGPGNNHSNLLENSDIAGSVGTNGGDDTFVWRSGDGSKNIDGGNGAGVGVFGRLAVLDGADLPVSLQQRLHPAAQVRLAGAGPVQEGRPLVGGVPLHGLQEDRLCRVGVRVHGASLSLLTGTCENGAENVSEKPRFRTDLTRCPAGEGLAWR